MNFENTNWITIAFSLLAAIIGAFSNVIVTKISHDTEVKKSSKELMVESYKSQIESANVRKDSSEALRLRMSYEQYEENWRKSEALLSATYPIREDLILTASHKRNIESSLSGIEKNDNNQIDPFAIGSAYLVVGDYANATEYLSVNADSSDPNIDMLLSLAYRGRAQSADTDSAKEAFMQRYIEFYDRARSKGADTLKIDKLSSDLGLNR